MTKLKLWDELFSDAPGSSFSLCSTFIQTVTLSYFCWVYLSFKWSWLVAKYVCDLGYSSCVHVVCEEVFAAYLCLWCFSVFLFFFFFAVFYFCNHSNNKDGCLSARQWKGSTCNAFFFFGLLSLGNMSEKLDWKSGKKRIITRRRKAPIHPRQQSSVISPVISLCSK